MMHSTKPIADATPLNDISGLKLPRDKIYSFKEIYVAEANNIALATIKYLSAPPSPLKMEMVVGLGCWQIST